MLIGLGVSCHTGISYSIVNYLYEAVADWLPRLGKREFLLLLLFTCNYVVSAKRGFLFLFCLGYAALSYCGTPCAFHIIILAGKLQISVFKMYLCSLDMVEILYT